MEYAMSIGVNCVVARYLRRTNNRRIAFPFDWTITPMRSAISLIETDFANFMDEKYLSFLPLTNRKLIDDYDDTIIETVDVITPCIHNEYNILFPHDFSSKGIDDLSLIQYKYKKRIDRLLNLLADTSNTFSFVAHDEEINEFQQEQYAVKDILFNNDNYNNWKTDFKNMMDIKYPNVSYKMYSLDEYRSKGK